MLHELHIESLGVIDRLDLVVGAGLTALTGETGAGKTMLVEAISLLVGGRYWTEQMKLIEQLKLHACRSNIFS